MSSNPVACTPADAIAPSTAGPPLLSDRLAGDRPVQLSCGGAGACASCHVHVRRGMGELSPVGEQERRTLALLADRRPDSRLACQARVYGDGVSIDVPDGVYLERADDLRALLGDPAPQTVRHPLTGAVLVPKGKIITRTQLDQCRGMAQELARLKSGVEPAPTAPGRFSASGAGRRPPAPLASPPPVVAGLEQLGAAVESLVKTEPNLLLGATLPMPPVPPPRPAELRPGVQVDKYLLLECVGQGGVGVVFRAEHTKLKAVVAVKFLRAEVLDRDANALARFAYEAQLMARLSHPNVVRVLDYEDDPDRPYVVMEYVDGPSAADMLARTGRLAPAKAVRILLDVADGLASAHRLGMVHRDVKPGNILVSREGTGKLVDLGLATMVRGGGPGGGPAAGSLEGTLAYMSPEQASGAADIDHRSDIYSLGVTFYHLVTGRLPFTGRAAAEVIMKHLHQSPPPPHEVTPGLSAELSRVVGVMLAKKREDRYPTCDELSRELAGLPEARRAE